MYYDVVLTFRACPRYPYI